MIEALTNAVRDTRLAALLLLALYACDAGSKVDPSATGEEDGGSSTPNAGEPGDAATASPGSDPDFGNDDGGTTGGASSTGDGGGTSEPTPPPEPICRNGGACLEVTSHGADEVDLLFMVDDSGSMREEQAALRAQFPALVRALTSGDRDDDGDVDFAPANSLHLGVVSSDLGLVGISGIDRCDGLGDDGVMHDVPSAEVAGCATEYPRFLTYQASTGIPETTANDLACIATLGTGGCGFEQQLESALKALWPADDTRVNFLPDPQGFGAIGQGDNGGMNAGFLRSDPLEGLSVIAVVIVTDEEDCSSKNTRHFTPPSLLDPSVPEDAVLLQQGLNLRCHLNPQNLYGEERYINAFKALRPGNEQLVVFSALVGVPPDAVADVPADYATSETARGAFYDRILSHPKMELTLDFKDTPEPSDDDIVPSCETSAGLAYPPHRIVEVAREFGANGMVQSICQEDFGPAVGAIVDRIASRLGTACLPRALVRGADGTVAGCDVLWALPEPGQAPSGTPTSCATLPFLSSADADATTTMGGAVCRVAQLAVSGDTEPSGAGWYYDDFSDAAAMACTGASPALVAFTPSAELPTGVRAFLDCGQ